MRSIVKPIAGGPCYHPRSPADQPGGSCVNVSGRLRYLRLARLVWKLPTYARIVWGLVRDPRTPLPLKALLARRLAYVVVPIDLIPDVIPILGQADDLTVLLLVLDLFIANAPREVREEQVERATNGTAQLDEDLARLRELLGDRYDQIRDELPELLERYGDLRDSRAVKALLRDWRLAACATRRAPVSRTRRAGGAELAASRREPELTSTVGREGNANANEGDPQARREGPRASRRREGRQGRLRPELPAAERGGGGGRCGRLEELGAAPRRARRARSQRARRGGGHGREAARAEAGGGGQGRREESALRVGHQPRDRRADRRGRGSRSTATPSTCASRSRRSATTAWTCA